MSDEDKKEEAKPEAAEEKGSDLSWILGSGDDADMQGDFVPSKTGNLRYWMPKGQERKVIFLTDFADSVVIWEHNLRLNGNWRNWFTCLEPLGVTCPGCKHADENDGQFRRYKGRFFSIIDTHEFKDRSGATRSNVKKLMCAKKDTSEILQKIEDDCRERDGTSLRGNMFKIFRTGSDKSPAVGDHFSYLKAIDLSALGEIDTEPFGHDLLAPNPEAFQRAIDSLKGAATEGAESSVAF